jgi:hypothetical protein
MKWLLAAMCLIGLLAFSRVQRAPVASAAADSTEAPMSSAPQVDGAETTAICPRAWTCNYTKWYGTLASCQASSCGANCTQDYRCTGFCVCP